MKTLSEVVTVAVSEAALNQMSKPTRTVVKILENNWPRIRKSCNYFEAGKKCPQTGKECQFSKCPLLEEDRDRDKGGDRDGREKHG